MGQNPWQRLREMTLIGFAALFLSECGGGGPGNSSVTPPTTTQNSPLATCPSTGVSPSSALESFDTSNTIQRRGISVARGATGSIADPLVIVYATTFAEQMSETLDRLHATTLATHNFTALAMQVRTVAPNAPEIESTAATLRATPGISSVERLQRRQLLTTASNDPVYAGTGIAPYFETSATKGQWDLHVMNLEPAWSLLASSSGSSIAIIDTGADLTQSELSRPGKVILTRCFVTYPANTPQSTGRFVTDTDGHGTDVAGIADADTNNAIEFAGVGWNAPLMIYRIFPDDVPGGCATSSSLQCQTTDIDEISAINDAVLNGAKVINLSIGATSPCADAAEQAAIQHAIAAGVVIVAAAGNDAVAKLDCPASYPGVIAVGATALDDTVSPTRERVASYSNYTTSAGGYFMVAPGGDPTSNTDPDNLHWVLNLYSSTAANLKKACGSDCTIFIAGTSQAVPHVVGTVSLMRSVNPRLTPTQIAQDLCSTADNLGDPKQGCGRVNAGAAVALAASQ